MTNWVAQIDLSWFKKYTAKEDVFLETKQKIYDFRTIFL